MSKTKRNRFFDWIGGRKQFNGYLFVVIISVAAFLLHATFTEYAMYVAVSLLGTSAMHAWGDNQINVSSPTKELGESRP